MQFKDIVGQRDVINRLTETIDSGRVSHAQMVLGRTSEGSLQLALAYVQYLCCEHRQSEPGAGLRADSCGECPSCKRMAALSHPDLHFVFPNAITASVKKDPSSAEFEGEFRQFLIENGSRGTIDDWLAALGIENKQAIINVRDAELIDNNLSLKSYEGGWKMLVVWMAERMNTECANKLLKTLEEPTEKTLILLVCESDERMLATIRSRVQTIRLMPTAEAGIEAGAEQWSKMLVEWLRLLFKLRMVELAAEVEKLAALGREGLRQFLSYTLMVIRACFLNTTTGVDVKIGSGDEKFDAMFPRMVTTNNVELLCSALDEAMMAIERNANAKIALMQLSFSVSKALKKR